MPSNQPRGLDDRRGQVEGWRGGGRVDKRTSAGSPLTNRTGPEGRRDLRSPHPHPSINSQKLRSDKRKDHQVDKDRNSHRFTETLILSSQHKWNSSREQNLCSRKILYKLPVSHCYSNFHRTHSLKQFKAPYNVHPAVFQLLLRREIRKPVEPCANPLRRHAFVAPSNSKTILVTCCTSLTENRSIPLTRIHQSHTVLEEINRPQPICQQ